MLFLISLIAPLAQAEDLIVDSETIVLSGNVEFDKILILAGGRIVIQQMDEGGDGGWLNLTVDSLIIKDGGSIFGTGGGHRGTVPEAGGSGAGAFGADAGGGGAYGGDGGRGIQADGESADATGGVATATVTTEDIEIGSAGGGSAAGARGGNGGAALTITAGNLQLEGNIILNGHGGDVLTDGAGGGGSGGGVLIQVGNIQCTGLIQVNGGPGGTQGRATGGGGGGGFVVQLHDAPGRPCEIQAIGGEGGGSWSNGLDGFGLLGDLDFDGDGYTHATGDCEVTIADAFPGAVEFCNGIDDNCDGEIDEGDCVALGSEGPPEDNWKLQGGTGFTCSQSPLSPTFGWLLLLPMLLSRRRKPKGSDQAL